jgi:hypothetical protein
MPRVMISSNFPDAKNSSSIEEFEDTKRVIRSPKSKKSRQSNDQKKKNRQYNDQKTEGQTIQWPKEIEQKYKQRSSKHCTEN